MFVWCVRVSCDEVVEEPTLNFFSPPLKPGFYKIHFYLSILVCLLKQSVQHQFYYTHPNLIAAQ